MSRPLPNAIYPSLKGRVAYVTGGATGIGCAIVTAFARQGMRVGFCDIAEQEGHALVATLRAEGREAAFDPVDVRNIAALQETLRTTEKRWATVDVLVNNVANDSRHDWRSLTEADWDTAMAINLRPAFFAIQSVLPGMIERKHGSIINFGSISWKAKYGTMPAYTTAKAAVHGLTRSFMQEMGEHHLRINSVLPGWVLTERQLRLHFNAEAERSLRQKQSLAGTIRPEDVAALALFLASDDSAMCSGQEFTIDGGWI